MNDSIWATVLGVSKNLGVTIEYALDEISYVNAVMYSRAMPMYGDRKEDRPAYDESLDANVVGRFDDFDGDEEIIRK